MNKKLVKKQYIPLVVFILSFGLIFFTVSSSFADTWPTEPNFRLTEVPYTTITSDDTYIEFSDNEQQKNVTVVDNLGDGSLKLDPTITDSFIANDIYPEGEEKDLGKWLTLPSIPAPGPFSSYTRMGNYIYCLFGSGDGKQFGRFLIDSQEWEFLAPIPKPVAAGSAITNDGQYVYALRGSGSRDSFFYCPPESILPHTIDTFSGGGQTIEPPPSGEWRQFRVLSNNISYGSDIESVGAPVADGGQLYVLPGAYKNDFLVYNKGGTTKDWRTINAPIAVVEDGGALVYAGDYIFIVSGNNSNAIYAYDPSDNGSWVSCDAIPEYGLSSPGFWRGSDLWYPGTGDYIYALGLINTKTRRGLNTNRGFQRFGPINNPATASWEKLPDSPAYLSDDGFIIYDEDLSGKELKVLSGRNYTMPWEYSIENDKWITLSQVPYESSAGINIVNDKDSDALYYIPANGTKYFFHYSKNDNVWTQLNDMPEGVRYSGNRITYLDGYIYCLQGNRANGFWRYDLSQSIDLGVWEELNDFPEHPYQDWPTTQGTRDYRPSEGSGIEAVTVGGQKYIYALRGQRYDNNSGTRDFYRYGPLIGDGTDKDLEWIKRENFFHTSGIDGGTLVYPDYVHEDGYTYIYAFRGAGSAGFYKFGPLEEELDDADDIDGDGVDVGRWVEVEPTPNDGSRGYFRSYPNGTSLVYQGSGSYLYATTGDAEGAAYAYAFFRYDMSSNSWEKLEPTEFWQSYSDTTSDENNIYAVNYYGSNNFWRYSYADEKWNYPVIDMHSNVIGNAVVDSDGIIYMVYGGYSGNYFSHIWVYDSVLKRWTDLIRAPFRIGVGTRAEYLEYDNSLYFTKGRGSNKIYQYNLDSNTWNINGSGETLCGEATVFCYRGTQMTSDADRLYLMGGYGQTKLIKYYPDSNDWGQVAELSGDQMQHEYMNGLEYAQGYIYVLPGDGLDDFYRINPDAPAPSWQRLDKAVADTNDSGTGEATGAGGSLYYPGIGDYMYCLPKGDSDLFFRFDLSGGITGDWVELHNFPVTASSYPTTIISTGKPWLFAFNYSWGNYLMRYYPDNGQDPQYKKNIWDVPTYLPENMSDRSAFCGYKGKVYYLTTAGKFHRYDTIDNEWSELSIPTIVPAEDANLLQVEFDGKAYIFYFQGDGRNGFLRYSIADNEWDTTLDPPIANFERGNAADYYNGFIYVLRGQYKDFWKYDLAKDEWVVLDQAPFVPNAGAELTYCPVGGNYLYALEGNHQLNFKAFSIDEEKWELIETASCILSIHEGNSRLIYPGFGNYMYLLHGSSYWPSHGSYAFLKYDVLLKEWIELTPSSLSIRDPGTLIWPGSGEYMYAVDGAGKEFTKYYAFCFGDYESNIKEVGNHSDWGDINWVDNGVGSTTIAFRSGNNPSLSDALDWSQITNIENNSDISDSSACEGTDKYIQYKFSFSTDDLGDVPIVESATVEWKKYPQSETFDSLTNLNSNFETNRLLNISWDRSSLGGLEGTDIRLQLRTRSSSGAWSSWIGPDGEINYQYDFNAQSESDFVQESEIDIADNYALLYKELENFKFSNKVIIDNTGKPAQTDITYGLTISSLDHFWATVNEEGNDIRFYSEANGVATEIEYYLAEFDYVNKKAKINIFVPQVEANSKKEIYLAYGAEDAISKTNPSLWVAEPEGMLEGWKFDDGPGSETVQSQVWPARFGALKNFSQDQWVAGRKGIGGALEFDGKNDYVEVANTWGLTDKNYPVTVSAWIKPNGNVTSTAVIATFGWMYDYGIILENFNKAGYRGSFNDGGSVDRPSFYSNSGAITPNEWNHIIVSYDGDLIKIYVNGEKVKEYTEARNIYQTRQTLYFGSLRGGWYKFKGAIDELFIYNGILTDNEIENLATGFSKDNDNIYVVGELESTASVLLSDWQYKQTLNVQNLGTADYANGVVKFDLDTGLGLFWDYVKNDGSDIRFLDSSEEKLLDYYIEDFQYDNRTATIYIEIPASLAGSTEDIYLYCGYSDAVYMGDEIVINPFNHGFDALDAGIFTYTSDAVIDSGELKLTSVADGWDEYLNTNQSWARGSWSFQAKIKAEYPEAMDPDTKYTIGAIGLKEPSAGIDIDSMNYSFEVYFLNDSLFAQFQWHEYPLGSAIEMPLGEANIKIDVNAHGANCYSDEDLDGEWKLQYSIGWDQADILLQPHIVQFSGVGSMHTDEWKIVKSAVDNLIVFSIFRNYNTNDFNTGLYYENHPVVQPVLGVMYSTGNTLQGFSENATKTNQSEIKYQFSNDGYHWYWFDNGGWHDVDFEGYDHANTALEVTPDALNIFQDDDDVNGVASSGDFYFRAYLHSDDGDYSPQLRQVNVMLAGNPNSYYIESEETDIANLITFPHAHTDTIDDQVVQYRAILYSDGQNSPVLNAVNIEYTNAYIEVQHPNDGEVLPAGNIGHPITWTWEGIDRPQSNTVTIEYSSDDGQNWKIYEDENGVLADNIANNIDGTGSFDWKVPDEATPNARVRITSNNFTRILDESDETFIVESVRFLSPETDDIWEINSSHTIEISFEASGYNGSIRIECSLDSGAWFALDNSTDMYLDGQSDSANRTWVLKDTEVSKSNTVKLRAVQKNPYIILAESETFFIVEVPVITIDSPTIETNQLKTGKEYSIDWHTNSTQFYGNFVLEYFDPNEPATVYTIANVSMTGAQDMPPNDLLMGSFIWATDKNDSGEFITDSLGDFVLRVREEQALVGRDTENIVEANINFSIIAPTVDLLDTLGNEGWIIGDTETISWTTEGDISRDALTIKYSLDGSFWNETEIDLETLGDANAASGSFDWVIPDAAQGDSVLVQIASKRVSYFDTFDISDPIAVLGQSTIEITQPIGGDRLTLGTQSTVGWKAYGRDIQGGDRFYIFSANTDEEFDVNVASGQIATTFNCSSGSGEAEWDYVAPLGDVRLKVVRYDVDTETFDESVSFETEPFLIEKPVVSIEAPISADSWYATGFYDIIWSEQGAVGNKIKIELIYQDGTISVINDGVDIARDSNDNTPLIPTVGVQADGFVWYEESTKFIHYVWWVVDNPESIAQIKISDVQTTPHDHTSWGVEDSSDMFNIISPYLEINVPAEGVINEAFEISWTAYGEDVGAVSDSLVIEYVDSTIIIANRPATGSYGWFIDQSYNETENARIKIYDSLRPATEVETAYFTIRLPEINLSTPNGGESWVMGTTHDVLWLADEGISGEITISYSKDGSNYGDIRVYDGASDIPETKLGDDGIEYFYYEWIVPEDPTASDKINTAMIKITDMVDGWSLANRPTDTSDTSFIVALPTIIVSEPQSRERLALGDNKLIEWTTEGKIVDELRIEYTNHVQGWFSDPDYVWFIGTMSPKSPLPGESVASYSYPWNPVGVDGDGNHEGNYVIVRITDTGYEVGGVYPVRGFSSQFYILPEPLLIVTQPATNAEWIMGTQNIISWEPITTGPVDKITIDYKLDDYELNDGWVTIATGQLPEGDFPWSVPSVYPDGHSSAGTKIMDTVFTSIRVTDPSRDPPTTATSGSFYIQVPQIEITSPDASVAWAIGDPAPINFVRIGDVDLASLRFDYSKDGVQYSTCENANLTELTDMSYVWIVEDQMAGAEDPRIVITDTSRPQTSSEAEGFKILSVPEITSVNITALTGEFPYSIIGDAFRVDWVCEGINFEGFIVEYSTDDFNESIYEITPPEGLSQDSRSFEWTVKDDALTGKNMKLRVRPTRSEVFSVEYPQTFNIQGGFRFDDGGAAPKADSVWVTNEVRTIRWVTKGVIQQVNIYYSTDSGNEGSWKLINQDLVDNTLKDSEGYNYYDWTVPNERTDKGSETAIIKIVQADDDAVFNETEGFEIGWYTINWQILDFDNLSDLNELEVSDPDRSELYYPEWSEIGLSSPIEPHEYPAGYYTTSWLREEYTTRSSGFRADSNKTVTVYLENKISAQIEWHTLLSTAYTASTDTLYLTSWLERRGKLVGLKDEEYNSFSRIELEIYDGDELIRSFTESKPSPNTGTYDFEWPNTGLEAGKAYFVKATIFYGPDAASPNQFTSGGSIDITLAYEQLQESQQLDEIAAKIDVTSQEIKDEISDAREVIESKVDDARESIETKVDQGVEEIKVDTAQILTATEETLPAQITETQEQIDTFMKSEILNRENSVKVNDEITIRYRTHSGLAPTIDVYDTKNVMRIVRGVMTEINNNGVYQYKVKFPNSWGKGDTTIICSESTKGTMDAITITIKSSDIESIAGQVSAVLGSISKIDDMETAMYTMMTQFALVEKALENIDIKIAAGDSENKNEVASLESVYLQLVVMGEEVKKMGASTDVNLQNLYNVSKDKSKDLNYLKNKTQELKAAAELNQKLLKGIANKNPVSQTWYEYK